MARWTSLLKRLLPRRWAGSLQLLRCLRGAEIDLPPGQVAALLRHAEASGIDNLLHLVEVIEAEHGHRVSAHEGLPRDAHGWPLPWFTYPAIAYLEQLDLAGLSVFEFGSGAGTHYFARRAGTVRSVEADADWCGRMRRDLPENASIAHCPERQAYVAALACLDQKWDIIVVDGAWRRDCARAALDHLSPSGWIILDNADWHPETAADLRGAGLLEIDFSGLGPVNYYCWTTSFFLRREVALRPRGAAPRPGPGAMPLRGAE